MHHLYNVEPMMAKFGVKASTDPRQISGSSAQGDSWDGSVTSVNQSLILSFWPALAARTATRYCYDDLLKVTVIVGADERICRDGQVVSLLIVGRPVPQ